MDSLYSFTFPTLQYSDKLFHDRSPYDMETSSLICSTNRWTGFYMIETSIMRELSYTTIQIMTNWQFSPLLFQPIPNGISISILIFVGQFCVFTWHFNYSCFFSLRTNSDLILLSNFIEVLND